MALKTARRLTLTLKQPHAPIATLTKENVNQSLQTQRQALQDSYQQIANAVNSLSMVGPAASMPSPGDAGRFYYADDSAPPGLWVDDGTEWVQLLPVAMLSNEQMTFVSGAVWNIPAAFLAGSQMIYRNGVLQSPGSGFDYTINGQTVTFNAGRIPASSDDMRVFAVAS